MVEFRNLGYESTVCVSLRGAEVWGADSAV